MKSNEGRMAGYEELPDAHLFYASISGERYELRFPKDGTLTMSEMAEIATNALRQAIQQYESERQSTVDADIGKE